MGRISFRLRHGRDPNVSGDGDIEGAFIRAGVSRLDAPGLVEALIESNGLAFKTGALTKAGIDVALLAAGLLSAGLVVEVKEDNPSDYRPEGRYNKGQSED